MHKLTLIITEDQIARREAIKKAIDELEYNPMCYDCKSFQKSCKGEKNRVYSDCVLKEK